MTLFYMQIKNISRRLVVITLILTCLMVFGCQVTPEKEPVVNKQEDYLIGKEQPIFTKYDAPEHVSEDKTVNGLHMVFDADVIVPEVDDYSVAEVEQIHFSDEYVISLFEYFIGTSPLFKEAVFSKRQIANSIIALQQSESLDDETRETLMAGYQKTLEEAPEDSSAYLQPFNIEDAPTDRFFYAYSLSTDEKSYAVFAGIKDAGIFTYKRDINMSFMREDNLDPLDDPLRKDFEGDFPISYVDALKVAENVIRDLKIEDLVLSFGSKACSYYDYGVGTKGWEFVFTRQTNGMPSYYVDGAHLWNMDVLPSLTAPWNKEVLFIFVDADGIFRFDWRGASRQSSLLMENVALLPFDDILKRAEQQLMFQHVSMTESNYELSLYIYEIRLGSVLVNVPGKPGAGRAIPAWDVLYEIRKKSGSSETIAKYVTCFNAIDGSYIEPRLQ